ncbi:MAG: prepilin-type N-terminal cleavage/methylation domain-containing protein [Pseudomonadota bacterium]
MKRTSRQGGFSLLEMLVALSILALSLGALYQAVSGATRNVRTDERYAYAVELARSLVALNAVVPAGGLQERGETEGGFIWQVQSLPLGRGSTGLPDGALQDLAVEVAWLDGSKRRQVVLNSVVEGVSE